ncbi:PilZ domain-containing protein [Paenibacillus barcinonensis]|nr:PilZ domain-containing protein [Paenibacillus barcinonensis]
MSFEIYILSINGIDGPSKPIQAELCDISRSGCQLAFPLSLPVENNDIRIAINLKLFEDLLYFEGTLRWALEKNTVWHYGVQLEVEKENQDRLSREMRMLAGQGRIVVK